MQDNNVCVGYARLALDIYNDRVKTAQTECDYQDEYYDNHMLYYRVCMERLTGLQKRKHLLIRDNNSALVEKSAGADCIKWKGMV